MANCFLGSWCLGKKGMFIPNIPSYIWFNRDHDRLLQESYTNEPWIHGMSAKGFVAKGFVSIEKTSGLLSKKLVLWTEMVKDTSLTYLGDTFWRSIQHGSFFSWHEKVRCIWHFLGIHVWIRQIIPPIFLTLHVQKMRGFVTDFCFNMVGKWGLANMKTSEFCVFLLLLDQIPIGSMYGMFTYVFTI